MKDLMVSVMTPCFNASTSLPTALASLIAQSHLNWECIVVDDGSKDDPKAIVDQFNDARFRFYRFEENQGRGMARQYALEQARGDYLTFLDADDWLYPTKLIRQLEAFSSNDNLAVVSTSLGIVSANHDLMGTTRITEDSSRVTLGSLDRVGRPPFPNVSTMFRMADAKRARYDPGLRRAQDLDFVLQIALGRNFAHIDEPLYGYTGWADLTKEKSLESLKFESRIYASYARHDPIVSVKHAGISILKSLLYRMVYVTHTDEWIARKRFESVTDRDLTAFIGALDGITEHLPATLDRRTGSA